MFLLDKDMTVHINMLLDSVWIVVQKYNLRQCFSLSLFLICSLFPITSEARVLIKVFLYKKSVYSEEFQMKKLPRKNIDHAGIRSMAFDFDD